MSDQHRQWTDEAVAALPLGPGRAELLEEIMSTSATDTTAPAHPAGPGRPSARRWAVPLAAAAAVAAVAVLVSTQGGDDRGTEPAPAAPTSTAAATATQLVFGRPGWTVGSSPADPEMQEISYDLPGTDQQVTVKRFRAPDGLTLEQITQEHRDVTDPPSGGEPLEVAGLEARSWSYNPLDRVVSTEPSDGYWWDVRAGGMDDAGFAALLGDLRLVDQAGFEASLPDAFVLPDEREAVMTEWLDSTVAVTGVGLPEGAPAATTVELDPAYVATDALDGYACPWFDAYIAARADGDDDGAAEAARVFSTARDWPLLEQADPDGDGYADVFLQFADRVVAGDRIGPRDLGNGLGCEPA